MRRIVRMVWVMALICNGTPSVSAEPDATTVALDAFWTEVSRAVAEGDFEGYAATYHPDAVLVSEARETSYPIASALNGWKQGFIDTNAGRMKASVEFRFTRRLNDETTAHETGIFHYSAKADEGEATDDYIHFEALLVRKDGWKMLMEYQKTPATMDDWVAAE